MDYQEKAELARNPNTPASALEKLSEDEDANVRYSVASNPNTAPSVLQKLASDKVVNVRHAIPHIKKLTK